MIKNLEKWLKPFSSLGITLCCLLSLLVLVFVGTLDQVDLGIFLAQKKYFTSFFVFVELSPSLKIPVFPGGALVGWVMIVNLFSVVITHKLYKPKKIGLLCIHVGLILLILGAGLTSYLGVESQLSIEEGQTKHYTQERKNVELAIIDRSDAKTDTVVSIPEKWLQLPDPISVKELPFDIKILSYLPNAELSMRKINDEEKSLANRGVGAQILALPRPISTQDDVANFVSVYAELIDKESRKSLGVWFLSRGLGAPQIVSSGGREYVMFIRPRRLYNDYSITLKEFSHDLYAGTDIPKNYSSLIHLDDPSEGESRDILIYMNHPLRYKGKTYFQASFGKDDTLSILQVVENPGWLLPYLSCLIMSLGLLIQFLTGLIKFSAKRAK